MKENMTVRISPDLRKALDKKASDTDRSLGYIVSKYLERCLVEEGYIQVENKKK